MANIGSQNFILIPLTTYTLNLIPLISISGYGFNIHLRYHMFKKKLCLDIIWPDIIILISKDKDITLAIKKFDIYDSKSDILNDIRLGYLDFYDIILWGILAHPSTWKYALTKLIWGWNYYIVVF
jgi:hypothetical protein